MNVVIYILLGFTLGILLIIFFVNKHKKKEKRKLLNQLIEWKADDELLIYFDSTIHDGYRYFKLNNDNYVLKLVKWSADEVLIELTNGPKKGEQYFVNYKMLKANKSYEHRKKLESFESFQKDIVNIKNDHLKEKLNILIKK